MQYVYLNIVNHMQSSDDCLMFKVNWYYALNMLTDERSIAVLPYLSLNKVVR